MSEDEEDESSKTEDPSSRKLEEARKKGNLVSTRELNHFFMLLATIFFLVNMAPHVARQSIDLLSPFITRPETFEMSAAGVFATLHDLVIQAALILSLTLLLTFAAALAPALIQGKWVFAAEQIKPKLNKLSPIQGFKRLYNRKGLIEFLKNFIKIIIVGVATVMVVLPYVNELPGLVAIDAVFSLELSARLAMRMLVATCIFLFFLSIVDYVWQRHSFYKSQRMTKQEVKEEYKQQEGDPHFKSKVRSIRTERARKRMMANVPKADVVITNPTHYAIALQYDAATMAVPKVVAKGTDDVAARIREIAQSHRITIMRNPPLARALYDLVEIDEEIPAQHYQAVAKIIGYVYKLKGKRPAKAKPRAATYAKPKPAKPGTQNKKR